jgi:ATP-dependent Clp protease ATP-binding subunit ClpA
LSKPNISLKEMGNPSFLDSVGIDLVSMAEKGELDPLVGREEEMNEVINVLSRRKKNNPLILDLPD